MELVVKGKNIDVTDSLRDYAQKKLGRVTKHVDGILETRVEFSVIKNPSVSENQIVEVTLIANGTVIRGEESSDNMYASIDLVSDKIERQIRRYQQRTNKRVREWGHHPPKTSVALAPEESYTEEEETGPPEIVRVKSFEVKPMTPDEASHQMELLGHNFFVFINQETNRVAVMYHRRDGNYGLIEPQV